MINNWFNDIIEDLGYRSRIAIGSTLILLGIVINEKSLAVLMAADGSIDNYSLRLFIWSFDVFCVVQGLLIIFRQNLFKILQERKKLSTIILSLVCFLTIIAFPLARGIDSIYYQTADQDLLCIFDALYFNQKIAPDFSATEGYIHTLILGIWIKINHLLSQVPISTIDQFIEHSSENGFGATITPLVISGRYFSVILGLIFSLVFIIGINYIFKNWPVSILCGLFLSSTQSFVLHTTIMRWELLSALFFMIAILSILLYHKVQKEFKPVVFFSIGIFSMLSVMTKIQIFPIVLLLPLLFILLNAKKRENIQLSGNSNYNTGLLTSIALLISLPFIIHITYLFRRGLLIFGYSSDKIFIDSFMIYLIL